MLSEAEYKTKYAKRTKILRSGLKCLKITNSIAQVKAGNTSKNVLNEIRQIIYSKKYITANEFNKVI